MSRNVPNLINTKFGRLTVVKRLDSVKNKGVRWACICDCGNKNIFLLAN